jgi:hypothetical protein
MLLRSALNTQAAIDTNVKTIGSVHLCADWRHPDAVTYEWYGEGTLGGTPFKGIGECHRGKADFPESGLRAVNCRLDLSGLPSEYVGGVLTSNTMQSSARVTMRGMETDPPGYTQASIATIRLWRKRGAPSSAVPLTQESLVGTWRLVSYTETTDKGEVKKPDGEHPTGFLTYTADGRVSVIFTHEGRKPLSNLPPESAPREETSVAFTSLVAYGGSYSVAGDKVTHHIEAAYLQNLVNTDIVRSVKLEGDRLTLSFGPHV